jgi:hypothetical protein
LVFSANPFTCSRSIPYSFECEGIAENVRASWSFRQIENYEVVDFRPPDGSYVQNVTYRAIVIPAQGCVECGDVPCSARIWGDRVLNHACLPFTVPG